MSLQLTIHDDGDGDGGGCLTTDNEEIELMASKMARDILDDLPTDARQKQKSPKSPKRKKKENKKSSLLSSSSLIRDVSTASDDNESDDIQFHGLKPCYPLSVYTQDYRQVLNECVSGIIVAFAQVPESIAFALLAEVPPIVGLHSAWIIGGIVHFFGGRPGMITGATGGIGAVLTAFMLDPNIGLNYLPYIILLAGIFTAGLALLNVHLLGRLIPETVMIGFVNGLAIIIGVSQFHIFRHSESSAETLWIIFLSILTFCVAEFLPRIKFRCSKVVPSSLAAIGITTMFEYLIVRMASGHHTPLIGDIADINGEFPKPIWFGNELYDLPQFWSQDTLHKIFVPALLVTMVSITEDILTIDVVSELTKTRQLQRQTKQQLLAMGSANIIGAVLGTMGGHATIGLSMINCHTGSNGHYRLSGCLASILVLLIILVASPLIVAIPAATLVGIMCVVVYHTFEWHSLVIVFMSMCPQTARKRFPKRNKIHRGDALVIVVVTVMTLVTNLAYAVISGIVLSALLYAWQSGEHFRVDKELVSYENKEFDDEVIYHFVGPLFFGNCRTLAQCFTPENDPFTIEIHLKDANIYDYSAIQAINSIAEQYKKIDKTVHLRHINVQSHKLIAKADNLVKHFTYEDVIETKEEGTVVLEEVDRLHVTAWGAAPTASIFCKTET